MGTNAVIIVFLDEVETTIVGHKCSDHLPILDQLNTITLSDGRVGLLSLNTSALGGGRREREREREGTFHVGSLTYCHVAYTFSSTIPFACEAPPNGFNLPSEQYPDAASCNSYRASVALASGHAVYGQFLTPLAFLNKHAKKYIYILKRIRA